MCVNLYREQTVNKIFGKKKTITCYKVLEKYNGKYRTNFLWYPFNDRGITKYDKMEAKFCFHDSLDYELHTYGIHVWTTKKEALKHIEVDFNEYLVPVLCERKHFIVADDKQAAFTQVRIHKRAKFTRVPKKD